MARPLTAASHPPPVLPLALCAAATLAILLPPNSRCSAPPHALRTSATRGRGAPPPWDSLVVGGQ